MLIKVRKFLTEQADKPVPLRTMRATIHRETAKAVYVTLVGTPLPTSECVHCGREISHPVSLHFGIGSTCIKKYPDLLESVDESDIEATYERLKESMSKITWEGWLPKSSIQLIPETGWAIEFKYNDKPYRVTTYDKAKRDHIHAMANEVLTEVSLE